MPATSIVLQKFVPVDQSNYEFISVKVGKLYIDQSRVESEVFPDR